MALIQQYLNKPLNEIELGRAAVRILASVKHGNRTKQIDELGRELGHRDGRTIRESMHTYRGLHPQIIPIVEKALSKGTVSVDDVRLLRTVRKDQQLGAQRLESMSGRSQGSDFIRGFVASVKPVGKVKASTEDQMAADARVRKFQHPHAKEPALNELVQAKMLRFFREVPFDAEGICPKCGETISLKNAQLTFSTPLWERDPLPLLKTTIEEIFPSYALTNRAIEA